MQYKAWREQSPFPPTYPYSLLFLFVINTSNKEKTMKIEHISFGQHLCLLLVLSIGLARCDVEQDKQKCANQVVGLATCLPFVSGDARAPPIDCCNAFKQVFAKSPECICLLVKDRNDPSVGIHINATRALSLPALCKTSTGGIGITDCPSILHLPPNSPDAKVFEDFANSANESNATAPTGAAAAATSSSGKTTAANSTSDGNKVKMRWSGIGIVSGLLLTVAVAN